MISVLRKIAQLNIKYRKKWGPLNTCLHRGPTMTNALNKPSSITKT